MKLFHRKVRDISNEKTNRKVNELACTIKKGRRYCESVYQMGSQFPSDTTVLLPDYNIITMVLELKEYNINFKMRYGIFP